MADPSWETCSFQSLVYHVLVTAIRGSGPTGRLILERLLTHGRISHGQHVAVHSNLAIGL